MRVIKMDPQEKWASRPLVQPGGGSFEDFFATPLQAVIVVLARSAPVKSRIVNIKTALELPLESFSAAFGRMARPCMDLGTAK